uniref:Uncharacterized protein n=1 Tax=Odontella aurita TaxID=265563 RepID=A0A7S4HZJ5_9STRA|mmetsp:Transcript_17719/g.51585  ORF Transcript_17719/g.51585 Transcript_17719/m.51585 type:complete len:168 (+) Transcript_17719:223-726(+)|eukprot:CAMPEP_0113556690 /NCGR_PEP_ID=MMETSP0015_2-20120614/17385_1 /TAXON_ID=2838 /ORGANISM="Odontella" /LENGTH=167 /DNA_ID=CAMNT_0000458051 /DNA_START=150 /DNA_END=653 /DNA_ORIENTATION=+ /assembly_acc=CAM_ASM_000160
MPRRTLLTFLSAAAVASSASAFHVSAPTGAFRQPGSALKSHGVRHSALEDSPWESDPCYFDRLREAAKDPETFEAFVASNTPGRHPEEGAAAARARAAANDIQGGDEAAPKKKKKGTYQRIEEWDEELKSKQDGSGMTWEEKVRFDGMRHGNGVRQNEILRHHLNSF